MAKHNYSFEKRQKELAKKKKKEDKRLKKAAVDNDKPQDVQATPENDDANVTIENTEKAS